MSKTKATEKVAAVSTTQATTAKTPDMNNRIVFQGTCPKLTTRGAGLLSYELGIDEATGHSFIRIAANASSGVFSHEWIAINNIRTTLDLKEEQQPFTPSIMNTLYANRSSNNYGYLAAILKAEGVVVALEDKPAMLRIGTWEPLCQKIDSLKKQKINLQDNIAIAAQKKAEKKAELKKKKPTTTANSAEKPNDINSEDKLAEDIPEIAED